MKQIDMNTWDRKEIYDFFSSLTDPFYTVSFDLDVTEARGYARKYSCSFYRTLIWCFTKAVNQIENFRYSLQDGKPVLLDRRYPSFTDMHKDSDLFHIVTLRSDDSLEDFLNEALLKSEAQQTFIDPSQEGPDLIYYSCVPDLDLKCVTSEGMEDKDDCIPRITWGRYREEGQKVILTVSMSVNHRFIDGIHLARFQKCIRLILQELCIYDRKEFI